MCEISILMKYFVKTFTFREKNSNLPSKYQYFLFKLNVFMIMNQNGVNSDLILNTTVGYKMFHSEPLESLKTKSVTNHIWELFPNVSKNVLKKLILPTFPMKKSLLDVSLKIEWCMKLFRHRFQYIYIYISEKFYKEQIRKIFLRTDFVIKILCHDYGKHWQKNNQCWNINPNFNRDWYHLVFLGLTFRFVNNN
jgi:hypothetical protein